MVFKTQNTFNLKIKIKSLLESINALYHAPALLAAELHTLVPEVTPTSELRRPAVGGAVSSSIEDKSKSLSSSDTCGKKSTLHHVCFSHNDTPNSQQIGKRIN